MFFMSTLQYDDEVKRLRLAWTAPHRLPVHAVMSRKGACMPLPRRRKKSLPHVRRDRLFLVRQQQHQVGW
jgi:hypothetical protein